MNVRWLSGSYLVASNRLFTRRKPLSPILSQCPICSQNMNIDNIWNHLGHVSKCSHSWIHLHLSMLHLIKPPNNFFIHQFPHLLPLQPSTIHQGAKLGRSRASHVWRKANGQAIPAVRNEDTAAVVPHWRLPQKGWLVRGLKGFGIPIRLRVQISSSD